MRCVSHTPALALGCITPYTLRTPRVSAPAAQNWEEEGDAAVAKLKTAFDEKWGPHWHAVSRARTRARRVPRVAQGHCHPVAWLRVG